MTSRRSALTNYRLPFTNFSAILKPCQNLIQKLRICKIKSLEVGGCFDVDDLKQQITSLAEEIARPDFWSDQDRAKSLTKKYEDLRKEVATWDGIANEATDLMELVEAYAGDIAAESELTSRWQELVERYQQMEKQVLFSGKYDGENAILSIHAGTGGVDAQDWAAMLLRMYSRFCERHDFSWQVIDESAGAEAGIKSVTVEISGRYAYGWLRSENGVHRLVRISPFDAEKMRHTSFALVEVLPDLEEDKEIVLNDSDLKIEVMRAGGHGGQSVNTTDSAVRLTHLPTGMVVKCQNERSQLQNKKSALKILKAKLLQYYGDLENEKIKAIKGDYQKAQWGNQARSYVLNPYRLVKDHRTDHETQEVERVLSGEFDDFIENYLRHKISSK